jgi:ribosomal-protein-alanine N-acetyltransferase
MTRSPASPRVRLAKPSARWLRAFVTAVRRSRKLHAPWVSPPATPAAYRAYLRRLRRASHAGYLICMRGSGELVGVVNISEIVHGALGSGYLGYYAFTPHARRGLMTEGLARVIDTAFRRRLIRRLGFRKEGYSPRYLEIRGRWRDHERWAILADEGPGRA